MVAKVLAMSAERLRVCTFSLALTNPTSAWLRGVLIVTSPSLPSSVCQRSSPVSETIGSISGSGAGRLGLQSRHETREPWRSEEHTSELQSLMRLSYAVFCLQKNKNKTFMKFKTNHHKFHNI